MLDDCDNELEFLTGVLHLIQSDFEDYNLCLDEIKLNTLESNISANIKRALNVISDLVKENDDDD